MADDVNARVHLMAIANETELPQDALHAFWNDLGITTDEGGYATFEDAFLTQIETTQAEALHFRPGGWVVKISGPMVKSAITAALLTVALAGTHATGIPLLVIPTVLPLLVDLDRVRLTKSEEYILVQLTLNQPAREAPVEELYESLPEHIRHQMSVLAFRDFIEKCRQAGLADPHEGAPSALKGDVYAIRAPGSERFRVTFQ